MKNLSFYDKDLVEKEFFDMTWLICELYFIETPVKTIFNRKVDGEMLACLL